MRYIIIFLFLYLAPGSSVFSQERRLQQILDSARTIGRFPGINAAIIKDNTVISLSSGFNDKENAIVLKSSDRMLQGSVGKTYVAAIALKLIGDKKIDMDKPVSIYLGRHAWFAKIPNAGEITVRMLLNHTSGVMRYEFKEAFGKDLADNPDKVWKPEELLSYIYNEKASFPAGEGWEYSDSNFILLGLIIEEVTGRKYYDLLEEWILQPLKLNDTAPSDRRDLPLLAQGYAGENIQFGGKDRVIENGKFIINPQFEWTGGGVHSTSLDLSRWGKLLYEGKFIHDSLIKKMIAFAVPSKLGKNVQYGLGVIIRQTPLGVAYGHSGYFPGYLSEMLYFPDKQLSVAVQTNTSDFKSIRGNVLRILIELAIAAENSN